MATFEEFVQIELPRRPFVLADGAPGQILIRSNNPQAVRELIWGDPPSGTAAPTTYTAGINLSGQRLVLFDSSYQLIYADNTVLAHAGAVFGLTKGAALQGEQVQVARNVEVYEPTWTWTVGSPIYLGESGTLIESAPVSPALFSLVVGWATATDRMFVSVGTPIFLS